MQGIERVSLTFDLHSHWKLFANHSGFCTILIPSISKHVVQKNDHPPTARLELPWCMLVGWSICPQSHGELFAYIFVIKLVMLGLGLKHFFSAYGPTMTGFLRYSLFVASFHSKIKWCTQGWLRGRFFFNLMFEENHNQWMHLVN